ncbi:MAG: nicotinate-nucleotide diphosphorylase (carboxylating), partial [Bacillaceae bacterium]
MYKLKAKKMIEQFLLEDIGERDITCTSLFEEGARGYGCFLVKADGVIAGLQIIKWVYELLGEEVGVIYFKKDGDKVSKGDVIAEV